MTNLTSVVQMILGGRSIAAVSTGACVNLMKEFLRREALWANKLQLSEEMPFVDLASAISDVRYSAPYLDAIRRFTYTVAESRCCTAMVNWYGAVASPNIDVSNLQDPYEPLMQLFQSGGTFSREHGVFIEVNGQVLIEANTIQHGDLSHAYVEQ